MFDYFISIRLENYLSFVLFILRRITTLSERLSVFFVVVQNGDVTNES